MNLAKKYLFFACAIMFSAIFFGLSACQICGDSPLPVRKETELLSDTKGYSAVTNRFFDGTRVTYYDSGQRLYEAAFDATGQVYFIIKYDRFDNVLDAWMKEYPKPEGHTDTILRH